VRRRLIRSLRARGTRRPSVQCETHLHGAVQQRLTGYGPQTRTYKTKSRSSLHNEPFLLLVSHDSITISARLLCRPSGSRRAACCAAVPRVCGKDPVPKRCAAPASVQRRTGLSLWSATSWLTRAATLTWHVSSSWWLTRAAQPVCLSVLAGLAQRLGTCAGQGGRRCMLLLHKGPQAVCLAC